MTMDKNQYKELIAEYMKREAKLKKQVEDLELKLDQQTQDFHFDMRNKQMEVVQLTMENANLKDELINAGEYAETDGYEVGSASDYEINPQLNLFDDKEQLNIFESPDGGETVYKRNADSDKRTKVIKLHDK